jgi:hypothetical protein
MGAEGGDAGTRTTVKDDDTIHVMMMGGGRDYVLTPWAARKLRESLKLIASYLPPEHDVVETPLHPSARGIRTY